MENDKFKIVLSDAIVGAGGKLLGCTERQLFTNIYRLRNRWLLNNFQSLTTEESWPQVEFSHC